ncbi:MAG: ATP-binding cassette domain-containing protein, partial [Phycisphaerales bacterium]
MITSPQQSAQPRKAPLLHVEHLRTYFPIRSGILQRVTDYVKAVDDVSFHINEGETLGLVGESGCGKTTVGRTILRLIPATGGRVLYKGRNIFELSAKQMRPLRRQMQMIFQDPY